MRGRGYLAGLTLFVGMNVGAVAVPERVLVPRPRPPEMKVDLLFWTAADADILARVAETEDPAAASAVMWTVLNRAARAHRPIRYVATQGTYHGLRSPVRMGRLDRELRARLRDMALQVLSGHLPDPTGGAWHFHRLGTAAPPWAPPRKSWYLAGRHAFYKPVVRSGGHP